MTTQTTTPDLTERVSKLEGAYEQTSDRLRDLTGSVNALRTSVDIQRTETDAKIGALRDEMNAKFDAQRAETVSLRDEMNAKFDAQRTETAALRTEMDAKISEVRREISGLKTTIIVIGGAMWASAAGGFIALIMNL